MRRFLLISVIVIAGCNQFDGDKSSVRDEATKIPPASGIVYRNPRVYNVDYSFEMFPDPNKIDRAKDLKLWIPIPREWESQKAVKIISVEPEPHAEYTDPEHGNPMLFWDFGKEPERPSYLVRMRFRMEVFSIHVEVDPDKIGSYDRTSKEYRLYTRSTPTVSITPKIEQMAREVVGDEKNPYLRAKRISEFVVKKVLRQRVKPTAGGHGLLTLFKSVVKDEKTGEEHFLGGCGKRSALFVALCRTMGIPARSISGFSGLRSVVNEEQLKPLYKWESTVLPNGLSGAQHFGEMGVHVWSEFYVPNYGWIPRLALHGKSKSNTSINRQV